MATINVQVNASADDGGRWGGSSFNSTYATAYYGQYYYERRHIFARFTGITIPNGATIGFSGFTAAGAAKAVPPAIARRAKERHAKGEPYQVRVFTGASTGPNFDDVLADAYAISFRAPYQSSMALRKQINDQKVEFVDMHLSHVTQHVNEGFYGAIDFAVVEATEVTRDGRAYLSTAIGVSPTYLKKAKKIIFEINRHHHQRLREMADIAYLPPPPHRDPIAIHAPMTKIG